MKEGLAAAVAASCHRPRSAAAASTRTTILRVAGRRRRVADAGPPSGRAVEGAAVEVGEVTVSDGLMTTKLRRHLAKVNISY
ncbi:hypothetical protein GCM10010486_26730 [Nonomuraea roseoviolacea subsp. carminata]